jgi:transcriptional regulator with XRE-family HTH domain
MNIERLYMYYFRGKAETAPPAEKLSLQEISEKTGMSKSYLNEIEKRKSIPSTTKY